MNCNKRFIAILLALLMLILTAGCGSDGLSENDNTTQSQTYEQSSSADDMFSGRDKEIGYDEAEATAITLADSGIICENQSVSTSNSTVTISDEGVYILSGNLSDGTVIVNAEKTDKINLVLNNVSITAKNTAPVYIKQADKVFITLAKDSENTLIQKDKFINNGEDNIDSVIFSKEDLTLNGLGNLTLSTSDGHGIVSKDDLIITSGTYDITAASHGISGKDCVKIAEGTYSVTSGKDGIHAENNDNAEAGFIYIDSGNFSINSNGDGISASSYIQINNGAYEILSGGGYTNAETHYESFFRPGMQNTTSDSDTPSTKGIKAQGNLVINNGEFSLNTADDALHSNTDTIISGGTINIQCGDDGIHSDSDTTINQGTITISESYEGIEGQTISVNGGNIDINASDDGMNAAGGNDESGYGGFRGNDMFAVDEDAFINITGGIINIKAKGDGIDSNGDINISGGETYIDGPESGGNGSLDFGANSTVTGGIFVAAGSSGMAQNFSNTSTQCVMLVTLNNQSGKIELLTENGETVIGFSPTSTYSCVIISSPLIQKDEQYILKTDTASQTIKMTDTIYGSSGGMMNGPGGFGGGRPGGFR